MASGPKYHVTKQCCQQEAEPNLAVHAIDINQTSHRLMERDGAEIEVDKLALKLEDAVIVLEHL